ncbi:MAG: carboxypeptidase-like regulatory domain-containing protein [Vulcanimicrobiaceae bacterium]
MFRITKISVRGLRAGSCVGLVTFVGLAGCGGGGGGSSLGGGSITPVPTPTPAPSANVSGTVVDEAANTALAGVQVSISAWTPNASPSPIATTTASGQFSFSVVPGSYMLTIGSNSPTDTRATLHVGVVLASGANALTLPQPAAYANVTYTSAQTSGNFRLMALSSTQQDCLTGANAGRTTNSLPLLIPDEFLEENAIAWNQEEDAEASDTPAPLWGGSTEPFSQQVDLTSSVGFDPCDTWTNGYSYTNGNPPYAFATNASNVWYGADVDETNAPHYGIQMWEGNIVGVGTASKLQ